MTAVVSEAGKDYCVAIITGKAVRRPIEVGLSDGTLTEVVSGLDEREAVVKANAASLTDGQPVEVVDPANPSPSSANLDGYADYLGRLSAPAGTSEQPVMSAGDIDR